eukprot:TRINITY_DN7409_c0_g2_i1.p1 TRINITY_DN7409_c0_g2~~TRINITY_DN7409_c0_g2_i1.p1  ORF type:complete len:260 (-),score=57.70 TRINITY_DN7409_c0_g2_i1:139-918(-)
MSQAWPKKEEHDDISLSLTATDEFLSGTIFLLQIPEHLQKEWSARAESLRTNPQLAQADAKDPSRAIGEIRVISRPGQPPKVELDAFMRDPVTANQTAVPLRVNTFDVSRSNTYVLREQKIRKRSRCLFEGPVAYRCDAHLPASVQRNISTPSSQQQRKEVQVLDDDSKDDISLLSLKRNQPKAKEQVVRRSRMGEDSLRHVLLSMFQSRESLTFQEIQSHESLRDQPEQYLRQVVLEICDQEVRGGVRSKYRLKSHLQ